MPKGKKSCFYDLRLKLLQDGDHNKQLIDFAAELGYQCIAVDQEFTLVKKSQIPHSRDLSTVINGYPDCVQKGPKVLKRLTVIVEEPSLLHVLTSPQVSEYDIIAVRPNSERTFQQACASMPVDVITMDVSRQLPYSLRRQQIGQAIERGIVFEICYAPTLLDPTARRYTFSNALDLVHICKGKVLCVFRRFMMEDCVAKDGFENMIISSGAQRPMELRAPYDVANLCHLFGLKGGGQCKALLTTNCQLTVLHAEMRKSSAKGIVTCCPIEELEDCDQWQIVDPYDTTTGARLHHSNESSSSDDGVVEDKVVVRKRKLVTSSTRNKRRKNTS